MKAPPLAGRVAAVTGSSSGIGKAIALALAEAGAEVTVSYHSPMEAAEEITAEIMATGIRENCGKPAVGDAESVTSYFDSVASQLDPVDILINKDDWDDPGKMADLKTKIPLGRIGEPEEIARIACMSVSDTASYLTGTTVSEDGGMTAYPSLAHGG